MRTLSHTIPADILIRRGYYHMVPATSTPGFIKAAIAFLKDTVPQELENLKNTNQLKIAVLQAHLKLSGFDPGPVDGYIGPATLYAWDNYKQSLKGSIDYFKDVNLNSPEVWPLEKDMQSFYGDRGANQVQVDCPYPLKIAWNEKQIVNKITIHEKCADSLSRILDAILKEYGLLRIQEYHLDMFGGSLNVRLKRGSAMQWSIHSWGAAIDWDPTWNQLRWNSYKAKLAQPHFKPFWEIWEAEGWVSLGRVRNYDWMHVQAARL